MTVGELKSILNDYSDDFNIGMILNVGKKSIAADIELEISDEFAAADEMTLEITPVYQKNFIEEFEN